MAQRVQVLLVDDIDGGDASETVSFALDGVTYEIDLSESNAAKFRDDLASWIGHARRSGGRRATGTRRAAPGQHPHPHRPRRDPRVGPRARPPGQRPGPHLGRGPGGLRQGQRLILGLHRGAPAERVGRRAGVRRGPGQPAHRLAGRLGAATRALLPWSCAQVVKDQEDGGDPTAPWREALGAAPRDLRGGTAAARRRGVRPAVVPRPAGRPAAYACALGPWVLDVAPEAVRFDLSEPELFPCAVSLPPGTGRWRPRRRGRREARARYTDHAERFVAGYDAGVKMSSRQRGGAVRDTWALAWRAAAQACLPAPAPAARLRSRAASSSRCPARRRVPASPPCPRGARRQHRRGVPDRSGCEARLRRRRQRPAARPPGRSCSACRRWSRGGRGRTSGTARAARAGR